MDITDSAKNSKIRVLAPNIHKFTSIGLGRITFQVGVPSIVSIEVEDAILSQENSLTEDDEGQTIISAFLLGISGAKVILLDENSIQVLDALMNHLPSPSPFHNLQCVQVPESYGGHVGLPHQLSQYLSHLSPDITVCTRYQGFEANETVEMAISLEEEHSIKAFGWAAKDASGFLSPFSFSRRKYGDDDVTVRIHYCGVCRCDLSATKSARVNPYTPVLTGHAIVGVVANAGSNVRKFKVGDRVGVGAIVNSCKSCEDCRLGREIYCPSKVCTYDTESSGTRAYGGFSDFVVVDYRYVLCFPEDLPFPSGAPLLCAGITVYNAMKYYGMTEPGKHLGVAGLGGLGHVAVKLGKAFGLKVSVISSSLKKQFEATSKLGADAFFLNSDTENMKVASGTMDFILDTVVVDHSLEPLLSLLKADAKLVTACLPGKLATAYLPDKPLDLRVFPLVPEQELLAGIGGIKGTQEMLDFCAKNRITSEIELIKMDDINTAMARLAKSDVKYQFVLDVLNSN